MVGLLTLGEFPLPFAELVECFFDQQYKKSNACDVHECNQDAR